jgi:hypothetical protein
MIAISFTLETTPPEDGQRASGVVVRASLTVDDREVSKLPIDLRALLASTERSGEYFIFTCGCGNSGCAGVDNGIIVVHSDYGLTDWFIPEPMQLRYGDEDVPVVFKRHYMGDTSDYRRLVLTPFLDLAARVGATGDNVTLPIHGMSYQEVIEQTSQISSKFAQPKPIV